MHNFGMTKAGCKEECDSTRGCLFASYGYFCRSRVHRFVSLHPETKGCCYLFKGINHPCHGESIVDGEREERTYFRPGKYIMLSRTEFV